jgi:SAM-dependent methyltransferase
MSKSSNPFDHCSLNYGRFRPDYPAALFDHIRSLWPPAPKPVVIDVGAGTGKASAPLVEYGAAVTSIEPSLAMIAEGRRCCPRLLYVCAAAEELPIQSNAADMVIAAQSFHWFDASRALAEFARILKRDGYVSLFWNSRTSDSPAAKLFDDLVRKWNPEHNHGYRDKDWSIPIRHSGLFENIEHRQFHRDVPMTIDDWLGLSRSISYVQSIGADKLPHFESEFRESLSRLTAIDCRYRTDLWVARKRDRSATR